MINIDMCKTFSFRPFFFFFFQGISRISFLVVKNWIKVLEAYLWGLEVIHWFSGRI